MHASVQTLQQAALKSFCTNIVDVVRHTIYLYTALYTRIKSVPSGLQTRWVRALTRACSKLSKTIDTLLKKHYSEKEKTSEKVVYRGCL